MNAAKDARIQLLFQFGHALAQQMRFCTHRRMGAAGGLAGEKKAFILMP
jgi:glycerate kinase